MMPRSILGGGMDILATALAYEARGWSVLPLCPPDHVGVGRLHNRTCESPGKRPFNPTQSEAAAGVWKEYQSRRATPDEIRRFWDRFPGLNLGVALGPVSGLVAVDVDTEDGAVKFAELARGDAPVTWEFTTGKGCRPLYRLPHGVNAPSVAFKRPGTNTEILRLMGQGSQCVMPPSLHPKGSVYSWVKGRGPDDIPPADVPAWWTKIKPAQVRAAGDPADGEVIGVHGRNTYLTSLAGTMRRRGADEETILAAIASFNERRCDPPLDEKEVRKIAASIAGYPAGPLFPTRVPAGGKPAGGNAPAGVAVQMGKPQGGR